MSTQDKKRKLVLHITRDQARLLEQERTRLRTKYGLKLSTSDIVQILIEMHRARLQMMATDGQQSMIWFHRYLAEQEDDSETAAGGVGSTDTE